MRNIYIYILFLCSFVRRSLFVCYPAKSVFFSQLFFCYFFFLDLCEFMEKNRIIFEIVQLPVFSFSVARFAGFLFLFLFFFCFVFVFP